MSDNARRVIVALGSIGALLFMYLWMRGML